MPQATNGDITLYYEVKGPEDGPTLLLINGYGAQLIGWVPQFINGLVKRGIRVVTMDNRDAGLSTQTGTPDDFQGTYTMADMADDVVAVAHAVGADRFHVLGQSMGGMIVQQLLVDHPDRIASATIFYSTPRVSEEFAAREDSAEAASRRGLEPQTSREGAIEQTYQRIQTCRAGSAYPTSEAVLRQIAQAAVDRSYRPDGTARQLAAIGSFALTDSDLAKVRVPVGVWHGTADPFFSPRAAWHLASHIPTAELHVFPGMAHEFPLPLVPTFVDGVARLVLGAH